VTDQHEVIAAPLRIDRHDLGRERTELDIARHAGADRDREVHVGDRGHVFVADHGRDLGALLGRELGTGGGHARRGLRTPALAAFRLHIVVVATFAALGLHIVVVAAFTALGLHVVVVAALTALGLHVALLTLTGLGLHVAALALVLGADALG